MSYKGEIAILTNLSSYPLASQIQSLEDVAVSLLSKRAAILKSMGELDGDGFTPKYVVFNNLTRAIDDDTFVLDPKAGEVDIETIEFYAEFTDNQVLKKDLTEWVYAHKHHTCKFPLREPCSVVGYNLCCGHCGNRDECFIQGNVCLCNRVANDLFTSIKECDG